MNRDRKLVWSISIYAIIVIMIYFFKIGGESFGRIVDVLAIINPLIAIYFGYSALRYFGTRTTQGKSIMFLLFTLAFWWLGDVIWWVIADNAVVSIADFFWILAYITFLISIYYGTKVIMPEFEIVKNKGKASIYVLTFIILSVAYFRIFPMPDSMGMSILEKLATAGYVVADLLLFLSVVFIMNLIYMLRKGKYAKVWMLIGIATLLFLAGDFYYAANHETYSAGDLVDLTWAMSYMFYAVSFIVLKGEAQRAVENIKRRIEEKLRKKRKSLKK